jgi:hypothetical protein
VQPEVKRIHWDPCVFLSNINGVPDRPPTIDELFRQARTGEFEILTSALSHAEVGFAAFEKTTNQLDLAVEDKIDGLWRPGSPVQTVEFYDLIGVEARRLVRQGIAQRWGRSRRAMRCILPRRSICRFRRCTRIAEIAKATGLSRQRVGQIARVGGWKRPRI